MKCVECVDVWMLIYQLDGMNGMNGDAYGMFCYRLYRLLQQPGFVRCIYIYIRDMCGCIQIQQSVRMGMRIECTVYKENT
jgi:hypothetical protein